MELKEIIKELTSMDGPSGREQAVAKRIKELLMPFANSVHIDAMGSVIGVKKCGKDNAPRLLLDAHMDEVGFVVTDYDEGFLKFSVVGGVDARMLPGREVRILADQPVYGVIACLPPHVLSEEEREKAIEVKNLYIDVGFSADEVKKYVKIGTFGVFKGDFSELGEEYICGKAMDDRLCVAILLKVMENIKDDKLNFDVYFMASVQEELGMRGAQPGAFGVAPQYAIALDVTHAATPDEPSGPEVFKSGCGSIITVGPNIGSKMYDGMKSYAEENNLPYAVEVAAGGSGTNAWAIQTSREGVCTGLISVPLKYMHSPMEVCRMSDAENVTGFLSGFIKDYFERGVINA